MKWRVVFANRRNNRLRFTVVANSLLEAYATAFGYAPKGFVAIGARLVV